MANRLNQYKYISKRELDKINSARRYVGLPDLKIGETKCLKCNKKFYSYDMVNQRMCHQCRNLNKKH